MIHRSLINGASQAALWSHAGLVLDVRRRASPPLAAPLSHWAVAAWTTLRRAAARLGSARPWEATGARSGSAHRDAAGGLPASRLRSWVARIRPGRWRVSRCARDRARARAGAGRTRWPTAVSDRCDPRPVRRPRRSQRGSPRTAERGGPRGRAAGSGHERAGEGAAVQVDRGQHLAALAHPHAVLVTTAGWPGRDPPGRSPA